MVLKPHSVSVDKSYCSTDKFLWFWKTEVTFSSTESRFRMITKIKCQIPSHIDFCFLQNLISSRFWQINSSRCKWRKKNTIKRSRKSRHLQPRFGRKQRENPWKKGWKQRSKTWHETALHPLPRTQFQRELNLFFHKSLQRSPGKEWKDFMLSALASGKKNSFEL